jgi:hypothetical protein
MARTKKTKSAVGTTIINPMTMEECQERTQVKPCPICGGSYHSFVGDTVVCNLCGSVV